MVKLHIQNSGDQLKLQEHFFDLENGKGLIPILAMSHPHVDPSLTTLVFDDQQAFTSIIENAENRPVFTKKHYQNQTLQADKDHYIKLINLIQKQFQEVLPDSLKQNLTDIKTCLQNNNRQGLQHLVKTLQQQMQQQYPQASQNLIKAHQFN